MLGSNAGRVHDQRQGTGLATVLQGDRALDTYDRLAAEGRAVKRADEQRKKDALDAAYERMIKFNPERWFKHEARVQSAVDSWHDEGTQIMAAGIDPWKGTDERSLKWRQQQIEVAGLAAATKQLQSNYETLRGKIDGAEPDKYTPSSLNAIADYFEGDLDTIIKERRSAPVLMQTKPNLQLQEHFSKLMQPINTTLNGNTLDDTERWKIVRQTLADPDQADELGQSFASLFAQMEPDELQSIKDRATAAGVSQMQMAAYDYVTRYETQRKPFDYDAWKKGALARVDVAYKEWQGVESFSRKVDKAEFEKNTNTIARDAFYGDDRALQKYESVLPRDKGETDQNYRKRATMHLAEQLRSETATQELAGQRDKGKEGKDREESRVKWLDYMMSPDPDKFKEAAGYLFETKGVMGNMTVAGVEVAPAQQGDNMLPYPLLRLTLKGDLSLEDVKSELPSGITVNSVEQRGTETLVELPVTTQTENYLLSIHDKAFDDKKKTPFGGSYREATTPTLSQMAGQKPTAAPAAQAPKRKTFNFK